MSVFFSCIFGSKTQVQDVASNEIVVENTAAGRRKLDTSAVNRDATGAVEQHARQVFSARGGAVVQEGQIDLSAKPKVLRSYSIQPGTPKLARKTSLLKALE
jgi:hypothetical protein